MKIITVALAALLATCVAAQAQRASSRQPSRVYIFGEYDYYNDTANNSQSGGGGGLGWNMNHYLGFQGGAQYLTKSGISLTNIYAEAKLSWPITNDFSVYASLGGAYAEAAATLTVATLPTPTKVNISQSATGYRAGLGAEYWLGNHWGLRTAWHRQNAGGVADDISVGIAFRF